MNENTHNTPAVFILFSAAADSGPMVNSVYQHEDDAFEAARMAFEDYGYGADEVAYIQLVDAGIVDDAESRPVVGVVRTNEEGDVAVWVERHSIR